MPIAKLSRSAVRASLLAFAWVSAEAYASADLDDIVHLPQGRSWEKPGCRRHACAIYPMKSYILGSTDRRHRHMYSPKLTVETSESGSMSQAYLYSVPTLRCRTDKICTIQISSGQNHVDLRAKKGGLGVEVLSVADLVRFVDRFPNFELHFSSEKGPVSVKFPSEDVVSAPYTGRY